MQKKLMKDCVLSSSTSVRSGVRKFFVLRIFLILTFVSYYQYVDAQQISITAKEMDIKEVFSLIKKQTGYSVFGNLKLLDNSKPISITAKDMPLSKFLDQIFSQQPVSYRIGNKTIFLSEKKLDNGSPSNQVTTTNQFQAYGRVLDSLAQPLMGANVTLRNKPGSVSSNINGEFTIRASIGDLLIVSYVGYQVKEIQLTEKLITGDSPFKVEMERMVNNLNEVTININTGYQTISRERSAGSVSKPNMDIYNDRVGTMNVIQRLDGLIPGLIINNAPGADPVQVRGLTTVGSVVNVGGFGVSTTNRSPLFVVDGVPYEDINLINPNDVVDVNVLKDATAASIWGARAANGVIVITTKSGQRGSSKLRVDYNAFARLQNRPDLNYLPVLDSRSYINNAREIFDPAIVPWTTINGGTSPIVAPHELALYDLSRGRLTLAQVNAKLDSMANISNTKQISELFYRNNLVTNHSLSLGGSTEKYSFYSSFNYTGNSNSNNVPDNDINTYKLNIRQDFRPVKGLNLYLVTDITNIVGKNRPHQSFDSRFNPYQLFMDEKGNNIDLTWRYMTAERRQLVENSGKINIGYSPLDEPNFGYTNTNALAIRLNGGLSADIYKGLRFEGTYSYTRGKNDSRQYEDERAFLVRRELLSFTTVNPTTQQPIYYLPSTGGRVRSNNASRQDWTIRNQLVYNKDWEGNKHQLTALAGSEVQSMRTDNVNELIRGFNDNTYTVQPVDYKTLTAASLSGTLYPSTGGFSFYSQDTYFTQRIDSRLISYYSNLSYSFLEKYGVNASWRIDQSNLFGKNKSAQNKPVYSVGAFWNLGKENWMKFDWLNELRLRGTYGLTGISPAPGIASSEDIVLAFAPSGFTVPGGVIYRINSPANRSLTWELTKTTNIGIDFQLFNSRISGSFDAYWKKTDGLLDQLAVNPFALAISPTVLGNSGELTNRGLELSLTSTNIRTRDFSWRTILNGAYNKNMITKSYNNTTVRTGNAKVGERNLQGFPANAVFAYNYVGLDNLGDPQVRLQNGSVTKTPFVTTADDVLFMGTSQPIWSGGFSNNFRYKSFDLQVNMIFNAGHVTRRDVNTKYTGVNAGFENFHAEFADRWRVPGDELNTNVPSFVAASNVNSSRRSEYYYILGNQNIIDASFAKIRDLTLSYRLPKVLLDRISCRELRVFGQLGNVMVWKANKDGIDPEFHSFNNIGGVRSIPLGQKTISVGVNVGF